MYMEDQSGMFAYRRNRLADLHREYFSKLRRFEEQPFPKESGDRGVRWRVSEGHGEGSSEILNLNCGLDMGLCGYRLSAPLESRFREWGAAFRFCIMLSGTIKIASCDSGRSRTVHGGDIWFCTGNISEMNYSQPAGSFISGLSVDIPVPMLEAWLGGNASSPLSALLEEHMKAQYSGCETFVAGALQRTRSLPGDHPIMRVAKDMLVMQRNTVCGRLRFESLALEFLSRVLSLEEPLAARPEGETPQRRKAVELARDILDEEWSAPPTISSLARRVGVNECYLKTDFREHTGMSIGSYVRKLRMEQALGLIESGRCSVLQAATFVGYSNPSHFSKAFKRYHGRLPSAYLARP